MHFGLLLITGTVLEYSTNSVTPSLGLRPRPDSQVQLTSIFHVAGLKSLPF